MSLIEMASPVFFILIGLELIASRIVHRQVYRLNDSVNDLSMGMIDQIGGILMSGIFFIGYIVVWEKYRIFDMGPARPLSFENIPWVVWITCFIAKDFVYYWAHRMSHEMNWGWATHIAHHQSEEYNLSVALRQGVFQPVFFSWFSLPLALLGFPPAVFGTCAALNTIYQFWIHTRLVKRLGPIEWIMNTPSHHRVHHGREPKYIDKNHAGVFIVWDRMFGTYQPEEEEPEYGIVTPLKSWNPVWAQIHYGVKLVKTAWLAPKWTDKLRLPFEAPAWVPEGMEVPDDFVPETRREGYTKFNARAPKGMGAYVLLHFVVVFFITLGYLKAAGEMRIAGEGLEPFMDPGNWMILLRKFGGAVFLIMALVNLGALSERQWWVPWSELGRLGTMVAIVLTVGPGFFGWVNLTGWPVVACMAVLVVVSVLWLMARWREFGVSEEPEESGMVVAA